MSDEANAILSVLEMLIEAELYRLNEIPEEQYVEDLWTRLDDINSLIFEMGSE